MRCPCAFRLRRLAQTGCCGDLSSEGLLFVARRARFLSYVHCLWQAWHLRDMLRSKMSFCVTGAWHRTLSHPRGERGTVSTLLKCWQARFKMRAGFGCHYSWQAQDSVNLDDVLKGSKDVESLVLWNCRHLLFWISLDMIDEMIPCGRSALRMARAFFVAGAVFCKPRQKSGWDWDLKHWFWHF